MATRAIKNSDGNVLKNSDGRILKANYDFGKAMTYGSYAEVPRLAGYALTDYTFEMWYEKGGASTNRGAMQLKFTDNLHLNAGQIQHSAFGLGFSISTPSVTANTYLAATQAFATYKSTGVSLINNGALSASIPAYPNKTISLLRLNWGRGFFGSSEAVLGCPINRFTLYGRVLSAAESAFNYNKGMGNDKLSLAAAIVDIRFDGAYILDFSAVQNGSDMRVGLKDYSGNNFHAFLNGLPAGTLQEQLAYANNNLFKYFRQ